MVTCLCTQDVPWVISLVPVASSPSVALTCALRAAEVLPEEARVLPRAAASWSAAGLFSWLPPLISLFPSPSPSFFRHCRLCPVSCLCTCCSFWLNSSPFTFPQGPTQSHPWGKLVRVPSPLASLRSLLLQRSVPFSRIIPFLFFPEQIPSARKPLNKKRNTCAITTDSFPWLLLCPGDCTHRLHCLLTAASSSR